ncbi:MAG TPA: hypothetical protein VGM13_09060 [Thermoanaerobaculia bacterium]|jgi:hypothetical protein
MRAVLALFALGVASSRAWGQPTPAPTPAGAGAVAPADQTAVQPALPSQGANRNVQLGSEPAATGPELADTGVVVNFEEGRNVVLRRADGTQVVYPVPATFVFPPELRLHEAATVYRVPLAGGGFRVTRLSAGPPREGESTGRGAPGPPPAAVDEPGRSEPPAGVAPAAAGSVHRKPGVAPRPVSVAKAPSYTVVALEGKSVTLRRAEGTTVTFPLARKADLPKGLAPGQSVTIRIRTEKGKKVVSRVRAAGDAPVLTNVN